MDALADLGDSASWYYSSFSALDRYFQRSQQPIIHVTVQGDLVDLARAIPDLEFPGLANADAATWDEDRRVYFRCIDPETKPRPQTFRALNLLYDPDQDCYLDPYDDYRSLRGEVLEATEEPYDPLLRLMDAAIAVSRYPHQVDESTLERVPVFPELPGESLRSLLTSILTGPSPWEGMRLLQGQGFVDAYWPELAPMSGTSHTKEHHPEGDVWTHSLETFRYRRTHDLVLTLALLFHDSGKPLATPSPGKKFDGHAELGARLAGRLLGRMGFDDPVIQDVRWLINHHMYPGAIHRFPTFRVERLMRNPLFPVLLELYRCDLESTFRGPEGYYRACKIYRDFLKNSANPFRDSEGKKLVRLYVD